MSDSEILMLLRQIMYQWRKAVEKGPPRFSLGYEGHHYVIDVEEYKVWPLQEEPHQLPLPSTDGKVLHDKKPSTAD